MKNAFRDYLDAPAITHTGVAELTRTTEAFKDQFERTMLVASLRVSVASQTEMLRTWSQVCKVLDEPKVGSKPPPPVEEWGNWAMTRDAARYDLGVRRDPDRLGGWRDRSHIIWYRDAPTRFQGWWLLLRDRLLRRRDPRA
jgi:hypothetical protein